jgi:hypothetical protein
MAVINTILAIHDEPWVPTDHKLFHRLLAPLSVFLLVIESRNKM